MSFVNALLVEQLDRTDLEAHVKTFKPPSTRVWDNSTNVNNVYKRRYKSAYTSGDGFAPTTYTHIQQSSGVTTLTTSHESYEAYFDDTNIQSYMPAGDGCCQYGATASMLVDPNSYNRVILEALDGLNQNKIQLGVACAEATKTASWLAKKVTDGLRFLKAIKTGRVHDLKEFVTPSMRIKDTLSNRWLEYSYALSPLVNDIFASAQIFNEGLGQGGKSFTIQSRSRYTRNTDFKYVGALGDLNTRVKQLYICNLRAEILDEDVQARKILGLTNPSQILWELVPYSFAVDWFVPIGTWLGALNAPAGLKFKNGYVSVLGESNGDYAYNGPVGDDVGNFFSNEFATVPYAARGYARSAFAGWPSTPVPYVKSPFSTRHTLSALALFNNLRRA